ncbi:hypothetical protein D3C76_1155390 [compost metagenome]
MFRRLDKVGIGVCSHTARCDNDLAQQNLHRPFVRVVDVHNGAEVRVPVGYGIEQGDGGDGRQGQRQYDLEQNAEVAAAVQLRRFLQTFGKALEEAPQNDQVKCADSGRNNHREQAVDQTNLLYNQEGRDQTAMEQHGENDHQVEEFTAVQIAAGQAVRHQGGNEHTDQGSDGCYEDGYAQSLEDGRCRQDIAVCIQCEFSGDQYKRLTRHFLYGSD